MTFTLGRQLSVGGARSIRRKQHQLGRELGHEEDELSDEDLKD